MALDQETDVRIQQVWQAALADLEVQISRANFETWLRSTILVGIQHNQATISAPNTFAVEQLRSKFDRQICETLSTLINRPVEVEYVVRGSTQRTPRRKQRPVPPAAQQQAERSPAQQSQQMELTPAMHHGLNPQYTFESFVVGSSNRLAHAAATAVAGSPSQSFNPLFFYGGVGLGKTHLLHAIGHHAMEIHDNIQVLYVSSERFTNELIKSIMEQKTEEFRTRYRSIDILMIDDIQFIAGKESTQEEFFHTFNELYQSGRQIILSSDRPPKAIKTLEDRLRSRFEGGLIADIQPPDFETRQAILRRKGEMLGIQVPDEVLEYVARRVQSNIRELEGALNKIIALAQLFDQPISMSIAAQALSDAELEAKRTQLTPDRIVSEITSQFGVSMSELRGRGRSKDIVRPRQIAMYLIREETAAPLAEIGKILGGRDHSTVMHGIAKIEQTVSNDATLRREIQDLRNRLYSI